MVGLKEVPAGRQPPPPVSENVAISFLSAINSRGSPGTQLSPHPPATRISNGSPARGVAGERVMSANIMEARAIERNEVVAKVFIGTGFRCGLEPPRFHVLDELHHLAEVPLLIVVHLQVASMRDDHARARNQFSHPADVVRI